jgi:hypothetical protein
VICGRFFGTPSVISSVLISDRQSQLVTLTHPFSNNGPSFFVAMSCVANVPPLFWCSSNPTYLLNQAFYSLCDRAKVLLWRSQTCTRALVFTQQCVQLQRQSLFLLCIAWFLAPVFCGMCDEATFPIFLIFTIMSLDFWYPINKCVHCNDSPSFSDMNSLISCTGWVHQNIFTITV